MESATVYFLLVRGC